MKKYNVRDVNNREIYESYMGILRISPDDNGVDDITETLKTPGNEIRLSDSDGDNLGITFVSHSYITNIKKAENAESEEVNLINIESKIENTIFVTKTANIRSTLLIKKSVENTQDTLTFPIHVYSKENDKVSGVFYPSDHPYDENYFNKVENGVNRPLRVKNGKNELLKDDIVLNNDRREKELLKKNLNWYNEKITSNHHVKVAKKTVYQLNDNNETIPVLYTHDKILAHGHGASYKINSGGEYDSGCEPNEYNIKDKLKLTSGGYATHLCWTDFDKLVWNSLENIINGDQRHVKGRYTTLGADVTSDIRGDQLGIIRAGSYSLASNVSNSYVLRETAPLVGLNVPAGNIMYNAMPFHRYLFYLCKQIKHNLGELPNKDIARNIYSGIEGTNITQFTSKDKHFAANLAKNFVLCDGKAVTINNYPALNTENDNYNKEYGRIEGKLGYIYNALKESNPGENNSIKTLNLINFNTKSSILLRGATWERDDNKENIKVLKADNAFSRNKIVGGAYPFGYDGKSYNKTIEPNKTYSYSIAHKLMSECYRHTHKIFSSASGLVGEGRDTTKNNNINVSEPATLLKQATAIPSNIGPIGRYAWRNAIRSFTSLMASTPSYSDTMGTENESLPVVCVGHNVVCRKSRTPEGFWLYYTAMPLNYNEATLSEFKNKKSEYRNEAKDNYATDRLRYMYYCTGQRPLYWHNKPIKNWAYTCRCINGKKYIENKDTASYVIGDTKYISGNRKITYNAFLKLMDEAESLMPAAAIGGWPRMALLNGWTQREGSNGKLHKHKTKAYSNYVLTGGYSIGTKEDKNICLTSLEINNPLKLGALKPGVSTTGGGEITEKDLATHVTVTDNNGVACTEPSPANINLIPLMRI